MDQFKDRHRQVLDLAGRLTDSGLFGKAHYNWTGTTSLASCFISTASAHYD
ncbi:ClbS/DfsB family four-helix bundle protein [Bacteroides sartorii]|uniref:ClbS/DfsB family four-helix bundle protein n=1 Tax=Phocaeicola sartorii TaxID=671267 RepID=A0A4S2FQ71_9BACT|nr:ClbS/DfsB family four-helix bundle protein [Phocaeicola sartorii]NUL01183.1 ClbS/DfsB family four-helix bundle protein [Phocaeicola sartorii]TGY71222.1 ClbS/DfsB family four-helix bundle protein [Phocaeicola sartorii]